MPAIPFPAYLPESQLVQRSTNIHNATHSGLDVVCAWPVSGQYGPGTRVLYYVLVAACVFARKAEWIRNAGLAAVLLFPAVAALHGIVLATLHREGAVDMDVYGAFQLCSIGILTAPATVKLSKTYFNNPGRNIIFLWTGLILAGLLSLTVEFIRIESTSCPIDDQATIEWAAKNHTFPYNMSPSCGMICGEDGPFSPLRQGAADNIYVIPVPHALTFNTATLISAACCVPAILSLVSTWIKILEYNWETFSSRYVNSTNSTESTEKSDERPIKGTNGATPKQMNGIAARIRGWLTLIEIPVFVAAVLAILVKGEMNFFSEPVNYQTEPITSIGQWAPIVGTGLAAIGSLYVLFAATMDADESENDDQEIRLDADANADASEHNSNCTEYTSRGNSPESLDSISPQRSSQMIDGSPSTEIVRTSTQASISPRLPRTATNQSERSVHSGGRRKVTQYLNLASMKLAAKAHDQFQDSGYHAKGLSSFPEVPGEIFRNENLPEIQRAYSPIPRSRASSFIGSESSHGEGSSRVPLEIPRHLSLPGPPTPTRPITRPRHAYTLPSRGGSCAVGGGHLGDTLDEVPFARDTGIETAAETSIAHASRPSALEVSPTTLTPNSQEAPKIVVSSD
ncbi:hypothetical protein N7509_005998 [Penicillium cosmopolitanum]|uniref:Uncharacterized protein n=1 Tax=Penicillium cosmopolitanum TaxID=1131564 RepID=A0A9W9W3F1_9EURO|nr:uncharacterized protein N7509_005998 [Penicillium cosmopolitanum]KAJ5397885.1 hypothetical protein N7509_005998 [Penicillium cosmopolitanum]